MVHVFYLLPLIVFNWCIVISSNAIRKFFAFNIQNLRKVYWFLSIFNAIYGAKNKGRRNILKFKIIFFKKIWRNLLFLKLKPLIASSKYWFKSKNAQSKSVELTSKEMGTPYLIVIINCLQIRLLMFKCLLLYLELPDKSQTCPNT